MGLRPTRKTNVTTASMEIPGSSEPAPDAQPAAASRALDSAQRGEVLRVVSVGGADAVSDRLAACGVWDGVELECLASAPFGGPLLFRIHGYRLALLRAEAARVVVARSGDSGVEQ